MSRAIPIQVRYTLSHIATDIPREKFPYYGGYHLVLIIWVTDFAKTTHSTMKICLSKFTFSNVPPDHAQGTTPRNHHIRYQDLLKGFVSSGFWFNDCTVHGRFIEAEQRVLHFHVVLLWFFNLCDQSPTPTRCIVAGKMTVLHNRRTNVVYLGHGA